MTIALQAGQARYDYTGPGVCLVVAHGSIFDAPAAMYSARQTGDRNRLNMTLYRLTNGTDMLTLSVTVGSASHTVSTVKVGSNGNPQGSGSARLQPAGKGGTLTIDATDAKGVRITGTVKCDAFNTPREDNGN